MTYFDHMSTIFFFFSECYRDLLTYYEYGESYSSISCATQTGAYEEFQTVGTDDVGNRVDSEGFKYGPTVTT